MIWYGMEGLVEQDPRKAISMAGSSKVPMIAEFTSRRLIDANELNLLIAEFDKKPVQLPAMLKGMIAGLEGRSDVKAPDNWNTVYQKLKSIKEVETLAQEIAQLFGDTEAKQKFLAQLKNQAAPIETRKLALKSLASKQSGELVSLLPELLKEPVLRIDAIRAMAAYDHEPFGHLLLDGFDSFTSQEQGEALQTLASRTGYGRLLTQAIKDEQIKKSNVPAYVARQLRRVVGNGFVEVWGPIDQLNGDKSVAYKRYQHLLTDQSLANADLIKGRGLFQRTCSACHTLYGEGGKLGPDITGSNRTNIDYLLNNLIEPSSEIQDDYRMVVITSRDGRTYSGNVIAENDRQVTLRVIGQDQLVLNKSDIQSRETATTSLMPEGLLQTLTDKEVLDLVAYLRTNAKPSL
jgi:putative heme-binding domain-containing protein